LSGYARWVFAGFFVGDLYRFPVELEALSLVVLTPLKLFVRLSPGWLRKAHPILWFFLIDIQPRFSYIQPTFRRVLIKSRPLKVLRRCRKKRKEVEGADADSSWTGQLE
jgi:hypothetical protein